MFEDLRRAWAEAVRNFRRELAEAEDGDTSAASPGDSVRAALDGARTRLEELEADASNIRERAERERDEEAACRRRRELADRIGDRETVRIAERFAARHSEWAGVLERKLQVVTEEALLLRREVRELEALLRHATAAETASEEPAPGAAPGGRRAARGRAAGQEGRGVSGRREDPLHDPVDEAFRVLEEEARRRAAAERVSRMKRDR